MMLWGPNAHYARVNKYPPALSQAALAKVKEAMDDAEKATSSALVFDSNNKSGSLTRARTVILADVSEEEMEPIVKAAEKARVAGNTAPQVGH